MGIVYRRRSRLLAIDRIIYHSPLLTRLEKNKYMDTSFIYRKRHRRFTVRLGRLQTNRRIFYVSINRPYIRCLCHYIWIYGLSPFRRLDSTKNRQMERITRTRRIGKTSTEIRQGTRQVRATRMVFARTHVRSLPYYLLLFNWNRRRF